MNIVEEIMTVVGVIEMKNIITLIARNPDSDSLLYTDTSNEMMQSI